MNNYTFQYTKNKYAVLFLIMFCMILLLIFLYVVYEIPFINNLIPNDTIMVILILGFFSGTMFLSLTYGLSLFSKNINVVVFDDYININQGEKILYFNKINNLNLEAIIPKAYITHKVTAYILNIHYNNKEKIKYIVYTGTSKNEILNTESLLKFHNEINILWNYGTRPHCI
jgi:hypothetical protein